jgi:hypothetical protein
MSKLTQAIVAGALLALLASTAADAATRPPLLKLLAGNTRALHVDGARRNVGFPVELPGRVRVGDVSITIVSVKFGRRSELRLRNAFSARLQGPVRDRTATLVVSVNLDPPLTPGTYELGVVGTGRAGRPPRRRTARLPLRIVVPAASLKAPGTLVIERTLPPLIWKGEPNDDMPPLRLRESSKQSRLTEISLEQNGAAKRGDKTTTAAVTFDDVAAIGPGRKGSATYDLVGSAFDDPGTVTGSVDIDADELAAPISFDYEVRITRSEDLIWIVAALGVVLGFLVRVFLQRVIDLSRAKEAAADLARRIEDAANRGDETLREKLAEAEDELSPAFDWFVRTTASVETAVKAAEKTYGDAVKDFTKRTQEATDEQTRLGAIVDTEWALPASLEAAFTDARAALVTAKRDLDLDDVDRARDAQLEAERRLRGSIVEELARWKGDVRSLTDMIAEPPPVPASIADTVDQTVKDVRASLDALPDAADAQPAATLPLLDKSVRAVDRLRRVLLTTQVEVNAVRARIADRLADAELLERALRNYGEIANAAEANPQQIRDRYRELIESLRDVVSRANPADETEGLIAQGRYLDAVPQPAAKETALGGDVATTTAPALLTLFALDPHGGPPRASATAAGARVREALPSSKTLRRRAATTLFAAWFLQWLITSAFAVAVAFWLFSEGWDGTWNDILEVFIWAFALDVSANTLIEQWRGAQKPAPTPAAT